MLLKERTVTAIAVLTLALGIGANTAIFSLINAILLNPLPYPQPDRLVRLYEKAPQSTVNSVSYPNFLDWRKQSESFEEMSVFRYLGFNVTGAQGPDRVEGLMINASLFPILGIQPALGRAILPEEDRPGGEPVVVISYPLWQRRFGGDPSLMGQPLNIDGKNYTIVGIMPADFRFYVPSDLFVSIGAQENPSLQIRGIRPGLRVIGRLKPDVTIDRARAEMDTISSSLASQYPESNTGFGVTTVGMYEDLVGTLRPTLLVLFGVVGCVLLIACANVANLLLARAASRQKEIAIRAALGASRLIIIRQLLIESLLLAIAGGALGVLLAWWSTKTLVAAVPGALPRREDIGIDVSVLLFTLVVSLLTGIIFGLAPALRASKPNLNESLKEGGRTSTGTRFRVQNLLVVSEVALALVLLICAGLMIKSLSQLRGIEPGLNPNNVLTMKTSLSKVTYGDGPKIRGFYQQLLDRLKDVPGVQAAAVTADMPLTGVINEVSFWTGGGPRPSPDGMKSALLCPVSPGYAEAMGITLLAGRFISEQDRQNTPAVAVIDEYFARGVFPNEDPVGKRFTIQGFGRLPDVSCEIVGVVGHVKHHGLDVDSEKNSQYQLYIPYLQVSDFLLTRMVEVMTIVARTKSDPASLAPAFKNEVLAIDKDQPVNNVKTMEEIVSTSIAKQQFSMLLLSLFAGIALLLAGVGIYGMMSYAVTQRTHEMGIRMALGATPGDVLKLVVRQGMTMTIIGVTIGLVAAVALTRLMASLLFGVSATDTSTFAIVAVLLAAVALMACYIPARRTTKVDPTVALRYE